MRISRNILTAAFIGALAACGGGGDGGSATTSANSAEGFWIGSASTGYSVAAVVLETGETWGLYSSGSTIYGAFYGNITGSGSSISGSGTDYNLISRSSSSSSISGNVTAKSTISATSSNKVTFTASYRPQYDQAASLSSVSGNYSGWGVSGTSTTQSTPVSISAAGALTAGSPSSGCSATGTVVPRASGKNVFNVNITFSGSNCALGNGVTTTGIAVLDNTVTPSRLYALALKADKSDGFIWTGTR